MADINWELVAGAVAAQDIIKRAFGPTADYYGEGLKNLQEKGWSNTRRVFGKMVSRLGDKMNEDGQVPPKVFRDFIQDAPFIEDELAAEYFGGVLASSRVVGSRDDRGAVFTSLMSRLSTYQLRSHYIIYSSIRQAFDGAGLSSLIQSEARQMETLVTGEALIQSMEFGSDEIPRFGSITSHVINGLAREGLIRDTIRYGSGDFIKEKYPKAPNTFWAMVVQPSAFGVELFNWAHGLRDASLSDFTSTEYPELEGVPSSGAAALKTSDLR